MADSSPAELKTLIAESTTTIETIEQSGWEIETNGFVAVFRSKTSREVIAIPQWVIESVSRACDNTHRQTQRVIRQAIGLE